jgi:RNA polymerase sigma-70 factor (ECF subfamily)
VAEVHSALDFAEVYRAHVQQVAAWVAKLLGPEADVEDVVHDVFAIVHRKLDGFRGEAKLTTWLYRITLRVSRRHRRRERIFRIWSGSSDFDAAANVCDARPGPHESLESRAAARLVHRALEALSTRHREAFVMFELEGQSGEEIAEILETKVSTVWVWLHRARAQFCSEVKRLNGKVQP